MKSDPSLHGLPWHCIRPLTAPIVLALSACAVGPHYGGPALRPPPPKAYDAASPGVTAAAPDDQWWRSLHDPVLDGLVDVALRDNPQLEAAEARVRRSREGVITSNSRRLPVVSAGARVADDKLSRNGENLALIPVVPKTTEFTDYRTGLDLSWEIDLAGRTQREVDAAVARFGSAEETRNDARVVIAAEVATTYVQFRGSSLRLSIARARDAQAEQSLRLVQLQRNVGFIGDTELLQAVAERRGAAAALAGAEGAVDPAVYALAALTGEPAEDLRSALSAPAAVPTPPRSVAAGLPSDLLRRRPDVRRAERELAAATADAGAAVAAQFPRLTLVGAAGFDSVRAGDLTSAASRYWNLGPQLTVPLFSGGRLRSGVRAAQAELDATLAGYQGAVLRALSDAESGIVRYGAASTRFEAIAAIADARDSGVAVMRRRLLAGDISTLELLSVERLAQDAGDQKVAAAVELAASYVALNKALGGGWQRP